MALTPPPSRPAGLQAPASAPPNQGPTPALERLLRDLGPRLRRGGGGNETAPARWPTGLPGVDRLLGGGFPRGRLSEVAGPASGGRTSLALALLASTTVAGEVVAVVDAADAFDPPSAAAAGVDLARVLWVRAPGLGEALRSTEHLLTARGFALVLLDLSSRSSGGAVQGRPARPAERSPTIWTRLRKTAATTDAALVTLADERRAGSFADLALELGAPRPRFTGTPLLLEALEGEIHLVRNRIGPTATPTSVQWPARSSRPAA